jgi:hypothetical protein
MHAQTIGRSTLKARIPREIAALMEALQYQGADTHVLRAMDDSEWKSLLDFSDFAHLTLALAQAPHAGIPNWVERRLQQNLAETALRFERVRELYREAAEVLSAAGIPHIVLKGFTQAPEYVGHPRFRAQSDLDFYCPPADIPAAQNELKRLGYQPVGEAEYYRFADHGPTLARPSTWVWKGNVFDPWKPLTIELHFCLWNSMVTRISIPGVDRFWERRVIRSIDGLSFPALDSVDHLGYLALHVLRDVLAGGWMGHHLYELAGFLHRHADDEKFWGQWKTDHDPQLRNFEGVVFSLAERWFSCRVSTQVREQMESLPRPLRAWSAHFGAAPLEANFRRNKDGRLVHFLLADTWEAKRMAVFRAFVPTRMARPGDAAVRRTNPYATRAGSKNQYVDYVRYLCSRTAMNLAAIAKFLLHALVVCFIPVPRRSKNSKPELHDMAGAATADATKPSL